MDDRIGCGIDDRLANGVAVEEIERDRLRPERPKTLGVPGRPESADHLVASIDQPGNESCADGTARPRNEDPHHVLPVSSRWAVTSMTHPVTRL
jgi:hypothetical protein